MNIDIDSISKLFFSFFLSVLIIMLIYHIMYIFGYAYMMPRMKEYIRNRATEELKKAYEALPIDMIEFFDIKEFLVIYFKVCRENRYREATMLWLCMFEILLLVLVILVEILVSVKIIF